MQVSYIVVGVLLAVFIFFLLLLLMWWRTRGDMKGEIEDIMRGVREEILRIQEGVRHLDGALETRLKAQADANRYVGERLDNVLRVIGGVQMEIGKLSSLSASVKALDEALRAPRIRGGLGELLLEKLLREILPPEYFRLQYPFKNGEVVDAVIILGDRLIPIDSKFPLDAFRRVVRDASEVSKAARREFINGVKRHIQSVAKYIRPDEKTLDFALMYVPSEAVYYEMMLNEETGGEEREIFQYAIQNKVIIVSPGTFYGYLFTILRGLRGMEIEKSADEILKEMNSISGELKKFGEVYDRLGGHLKNALASYEDGQKRRQRLEERLGRVHFIRKGDEVSNIS
jgi:DNA recombination protein RmuC